MKTKKLIIIIIGILILSSPNIFSETKKLREIGRYKLVPIKEGTPTEEVMKTIGERYTEDIKYGFDLAGYVDLFLPFIDQIKKSAFKEKELAIGDKMMWMIFRSQGKVKIVHDLEWAGKEPLPVFSFTVATRDKNYEIIMPKSCGNIALLKAEAIPGAVIEPKALEVKKEEEKVPEEELLIRKGKIYEEIYNLLQEVDLYCSFLIWEDEIPEMKIVGAERESERNMFSNGDVIYLNKGKDDGLEPDQIFLIMEIKDNLRGYGKIAQKKGRARIRLLADTTSTAVIENSCADVRIGHYLVPFEALEGFMGKDLGYDVLPFEAEEVKGELIYLQSNYNLIGSGHWALINLGAEDGIEVGNQLILCRKIREEAPMQILGNSVVINVQSRTSTIKILSCRDALHRGDLITVRPSQ